MLGKHTAFDPALEDLKNLIEEEGAQKIRDAGIVS